MIFALLLVAVSLAAVLAVYAAICAFVAHRFTTARRVAPVDCVHAATPSTAVTLPSRGRHVTLHGWYLPAAPGGAAVVFVHGKDACRGIELRAPTFELARAHVAAGISVLMIDLRGHGASTRARMTYGAEEKLDVLGAVDWLRQLGHRRVGVLGASMGAASALLAAADDTGPDLDWAMLARPRQTVVVYMGVGALGVICRRLIEHGLAADTPAATIERATRPDQRTVTGTLATLPDLARTMGVRPPALIIIGGVVSLHAELAGVQHARSMPREASAGPTVPAGTEERLCELMLGLDRAEAANP